MDNLRWLLKEVGVFNRRLKYKEECEDRFNLFDLMCDRFDEVNLHSRFLSVLLDPAGSHKMKDLFVRLFVYELGLPFDYDVDSLEVYPNERSLHEYKEIDILLMDRKRRSAIIIENKIWAPDSNHVGEGQLERYYRVVTQEEQMPEERTSVIYLSIDRDSPSEESVGTSGQFPGLRDKVISVHYGDKLLGWLKRCARESYNKPFLRESIMQYIRLIEDMTNSSAEEDDIKALMEIVGKNDDSLGSARRLMENSRHIHWWAVFGFWKQLSDKFAASGYTIRRRIENSIIDDMVHGSTVKRNKAHFNLELATPDGMDFTINADYGYCLGVGVTDADVDSGLKEKAEAFYDGKGEALGLVKFDYWPFFKYFDFPASSGLCLNDFCDELTFSLVSDKRREDIVEEVFSQTKGLLKQWTRFVRS